MFHQNFTFDAISSNMNEPLTLQQLQDRPVDEQLRILHADLAEMWRVHNHNVLVINQLQHHKNALQQELTRLKSTQRFN